MEVIITIAWRFITFLSVLKWDGNSFSKKNSHSCFLTSPFDKNHTIN